MTVALYPGKFDPVTNGHLDIVRRASSLFDQLIVAVYALPNTFFTADERVDLFDRAVEDLPNVRVLKFDGLVVHFARDVGATVLVRGIRAVTGFEAEFDMALMNKKMAPEIESVFLMASIEHLFVSASRIREIASLGYDPGDLVPAHVKHALLDKFQSPAH
ncbi:MAG TPA: pantetheine-phosphate adenylyltransferase [Dehalococcoidia bacterium]|nr:pantetheine-phosphate adenylyltransferase [Dehalococcoidia bacterium]